MDSSLFFNAFIYLAAATLAAPLGRRLGIGAVLGYLVVGAVIGPAGLEFTGRHSEEVLHFAEFGVVLMLFVIGLELDLGKLWRMRTSIFGLGGLQLVLSACALALAAGILATDWREALGLGLILALSSTAIVMQTLKERGLTETSSGKQGFAVLLFQDIAIIPILAFLPTLAHRTVASSSGDHARLYKRLFSHQSLHRSLHENLQKLRVDQIDHSRFRSADPTYEKYDNCDITGKRLGGIWPRRPCTSSCGKSGEQCPEDRERTVCF